MTRERAPRIDHPCCQLSALLLVAVLFGWADAQAQTPGATIQLPEIGNELRIERSLEMVKLQAVRPDGKLQLAIPEGQLRVLRPAGTGWKESDDGTEDGDGQTDIELMPNEAVFLQETPSAPVTFSKDKQAHTFGRLMMNRRPTAIDEPSLQQWDLVVAARRLPAHWESESRAYVAELLIWFDGINTTDSVELPDPIPVQFLARNGEVKPASFELKKTGVDGSAGEIRFAAPWHDQRSEVEAVTNGARTKLAIDLGADLSRISLGVQKSSIPGWGLAETNLVVTRYAQDGRPFKSAEPLAVMLKASDGIFPAKVEIPAEEAQVLIPLRSAGLGTVEVVAKARGQIEDSAHVDFLFPWALFAITTLLGAAGGLLRAATPREDAQQPRWLKSALEGVFAAIVAVPLVIVGARVINVPQELVGTGIGALVVAAVAGYGGATVLDYLYEYFFGSRTLRS